MLHIRRYYLRNKGFTLVELILTMAISLLIILPLLSILSLSTRSCALTEEKDELMLNANFAIDYIKYEIKSADTIISSDKFKELNFQYPSNIGFVVKINDDTLGKYRYITYYTNKKSLIRIACEKEIEDYPESIEFKGFNKICDFVENIENSKLDGENSIINLDFKFKNRCELDFKFDIYIRCEIDY